MTKGTLACVLGSCAAIAACSSPNADSSAGDTGETADAIVEARHLGMTDVTVLYPLPRTSEYYDDLMSPSSEGERGELFSPEVFEQLMAVRAPVMYKNDGTPLDPQAPLFSRFADQFANLRIVAVRLDPCFGESVAANMGAATCQNTIRLVAQFITPTSTLPIPESRAAIHLFYSVTRAEFTAVLKGMLALRKKAGLPIQKGFIKINLPSPAQVETGFGVHPSLASEGLRGPYATGLRDLLLTYAGNTNLSQVAFSVQDRGAVSTEYYGDATAFSQSNRWAFGRFDVREGTLYAQNVASLSFAGVQTSDIEPAPQAPAPGGPKRDIIIVTPLPKTSDNYFAIFNRSGVREVAEKSAINILNPTKYTARNTDCVTCHLADQAIPRLPLPSENPMAFKSNTWRLNYTPQGAGPFHMLGWVAGGNSNPGTVMASRVVNETAIVLDYVNKSILK